MIVEDLISSEAACFKKAISTKMITIKEHGNPVRGMA